MTNEPCTKIVIDAANLIHDDRGIEKKDENGEHIIQMIPQRLVSAVEVCRKKGYRVSALLKHGTYMYGIIQYKSNNPEYADFTSIIQLKEAGIVKLISSKNDDLFIVEHGLNQNALILSRDWFNDHREARPDIDWEKVNTLRVNDYQFIDDVFTCPTIQDITHLKPQPKKVDPFDEVKELLQIQAKELQSLKERVHELEERDLSKEIASMSEKEIQSTAIRAKKDSARAKTPSQTAREYVNRSKQNGFRKLREKAALLKDIEKRGLASNQGAGRVLSHLEKLKVINVNKNSVEWR
ncbi:hypothetical protein N9X52_03165 [Candidatus Poseidonia alphae]|nr:hypothetical protein [Candidatus Poseidonia alphae]